MMIRRHRAFLLLALVLVLATRAAIPTGWMPMVDADGIRLALCAGQAPPQTALVDEESSHAGMHHGGMSHEDMDHEEQPRETCPYGVIGFAAALPDEPAAIAVPVFELLTLAPPAVQEITTRRLALRPPTRGPPSFA